MKESGYYPTGAEFDPSAPWNEQSPKERDFDVTIEFVMQKQARVTTDDYLCEYDDEYCADMIDTRDTDFEKAYKESGYYTIEEMLAKLKQYVLEDMKKCSPNTCKGNSLKCLLSSCDGWTVIDKSFQY